MASRARFAGGESRESSFQELQETLVSGHHRGSGMLCASSES